MRVLLHGDYGRSTGFGRVTERFGEALVARGHEVHVLAVNWNGWPVPKDSKIKPYFTDPKHRGDPFGETSIEEVISIVKPDVYCCINDLPLARDFLLRARSVPRALYFPVDGVNLPQYWLHPVRLAHTAATYTQWGLRQVLAADPSLEHVRVIPHGVDDQVFYPVSPRRPITIKAPWNEREVTVTSRDQLRTLLGLHGQKVVLWSDRNTVRKNGELLLRVAADPQLTAAFPNMRLWMHCSPRDEGGDLSVWMESYRLARSVQFTGSTDFYHGIPDAMLNALYNAVDVRVSTSLGEGYGLHTIEAAAAGCPQILPANSCFEEVGGPGNLYYESPTWFPTGRSVHYSLPSAEALTAALHAVLADPDSWRTDLQASLGHQMHINDALWERRYDAFEQLLLDAVAEAQRPRMLAGSR